MVRLVNYLRLVFESYKKEPILWKCKEVRLSKVMLKNRIRRIVDCKRDSSRVMRSELVDVLTSWG